MDSSETEQPMENCSIAVLECSACTRTIPSIEDERCFCMFGFGAVDVFWGVQFSTG